MQKKQPAQALSQQSPQSPLFSQTLARVRKFLYNGWRIMTFTLTVCAVGMLAPNGAATPDTLAFTSVSVVTSGTNQFFHITAAWPQSMEIPDNMLAVLSSTSLASNSWDWTDTIDVNPLAGTAEKKLSMTGDRMFYKLATMADTNDSGAPDFWEKIIINNPDYYLDSDGDGLPDWYEEYIGIDPNDPYSIALNDLTNPDYFDELGNPLADGVIVLNWQDPMEGRTDNTLSDWGGLTGIDLSLCDMWLDDDGWALDINVPFKYSPETNAVWNSPGEVLTNITNVEIVAHQTIFIQAGQDVKFNIERVEIGQDHWWDEFVVTIEAFIPKPNQTDLLGNPMWEYGYEKIGAPNWLEWDENPGYSAEVPYGPNDEPPDVSKYFWWFTLYMATNVTVDSDSGGLCVEVGTDITMRCDIKPNPESAKVPLPHSALQWQFREKNFQGEWNGWFNVGQGAKPTQHTYASEQGGVFGIRALFFGEDFISPKYRRNQDEPYGTTVKKPNLSINAWWRKGQPNAVGVCDTKFQVLLRKAARAQLGSTFYSDNNILPARYGCLPYPAGIAKCNIFVAHMCRSIDINSVQLFTRILLSGLKDHPPTSKEWYNGSLVRFEWPVAKNLQPGCVISTGSHMGITDYDGEGINAGAMEIHKAYNFFNAPQFLYRFYNDYFDWDD